MRGDLCRNKIHNRKLQSTVHLWADNSSNVSLDGNYLCMKLYLIEPRHRFWFNTISIFIIVHLVDTVSEVGFYNCKVWENNYIPIKL